MNQSKARGTFEKRKAQSIERKRKAVERLKEIEAEQSEIARQIEINMPPGERQKRNARRLKLAQQLAMIQGLACNNPFGIQDTFILKMR